MNNITMRQAIIKTVELHPGCNDHKLALDVMGFVNPQRFDPDIYDAILAKMVKDKEVVVLEYILPEVLCTLKQLYFPKGTAFVMDKING